MALGVYDWVYGIAQLAAGFLAIIAGILALSMLKVSHEKKILQGWRWLIWALVFFVLVEIVGGLNTFGISFGILGTPWLTHVLAGLVLIFLITALVTEAHIKEGCRL